MTKLYTQVGDKGYTVVRAQHLLKGSPQVVALGAIDELSSYIGLCVTLLKQEEVKYAQLLERVQHNLFAVGAQLAGSQVCLEETNIKSLETLIDHFSSILPPLDHFILPGGSVIGAHLHIARTICCRAEQNLSHCQASSELNKAYINRLSDFLFVFARFINKNNPERKASE